MTKNAIQMLSKEAHALAGKFKKAGGSLDEWISIGRDVLAPSERATTRVPQGQPAPARSTPSPQDGASIRVPQGRSPLAPSNHSITGLRSDALSGHSRAAGENNSGHKSLAPSGQSRSAAKKPGKKPIPRQQSEAEIKAMALVKQETGRKQWNLGVLSGRVPGGPEYLDLRGRDLDGMISRQFSESATHGFSAYICLKMKEEVDRLQNVDLNDTVEHILGRKTLEKIAREVGVDNMKPKFEEAVKFISQIDSPEVETV